MNNIARAKSVSQGTGHWTTTVPQLDTWLEGSSISSDLISEVSSIKDSEILDLDITNNSDIVVVSTVEEVEVSVHQGSHLPVGVTSAVLVTERAQPRILWFQCRSSPKY